ncbi:MAG: DUF2508 family protein [Bacillota bacterium]
MLNIIRTFLLNIATVFFPVEEQATRQEPEDYYKIVEQARREWQNAKQRFEQISDPDLIDHAIYAIESAERRYIYLLKKANKEERVIHTDHLTGVSFPRPGKE